MWNCFGVHRLWRWKRCRAVSAKIRAAGGYFWLGIGEKDLEEAEQDYLLTLIVFVGSGMVVMV